MTGFSYTSVKEILVVDGGAGRLGPLLRDRFAAVSQVMIITDPGLVNLGMAGVVEASLTKAGYGVSLYSDVEPDPPENKVLAAIEAARTQGADLIVGLGGGSSMDCAKLVAALKNSDQPLSDCYGVGALKGGRLPLVQIPTTAGSGSECTAVAIVTTGADSKMGIVSPTLFADLALLDATLTLGLPPALTAFTAIDAMVHAIEAFTSRIKKNPLSDMAAKEALRRIGGQFAAVMKDGSNLAARRDILVGASLAGAAFANAPVGAVHALAYPLGAVHHVPHGLSNSLMLPAVLRYNQHAADGLYAALAVNQDVGQRSEDFFHWINQMIDLSGLPTRLRDVGVSEADLERLAKDSQLQTRLLVNNPREVLFEAALSLYQEVY